MVRHAHTCCTVGGGDYCAALGRVADADAARGMGNGMTMMPTVHTAEEKPRPAAQARAWWHARRTATKGTVHGIRTGDLRTLGIPGQAAARAAPGCTAR